jgi:hypothetical protein
MPNDDWDGGTNKGREAAVYSYEELLVALREHCKDVVFWRRALNASRRIWWRGRNAPDELVHAAVVKLLGYVKGGGVVPRDRSLLAALVWNMGVVAKDYFRSADALGPKHADQVGETALAAALDRKGPPNSNPELQAEALDLMRKMYALAEEQERRQKEDGKTRVLPLGEFLRLRLEEGLEGMDVRRALNLTKQDLDALIAQVKRLRERLNLKGDR